MSRKVSVSEVIRHNSAEDAWIVVDGRVYDMTDFAPSHPGGPQIIYKYAGSDASHEYNQFHAPSLIRKSLDRRYHKGHLDTSTITEEWARATSAPKEGGPEKTVSETDKPPLTSIINLYDLEGVAERTLSSKAWAYINGGSNDSFTRDANQNTLRKIWFRPAVMRNVSKVDTTTELFGCSLGMPFYAAPTGTLRTGGPEGELAIAKAANAKGIIQCVSTPASFPHDEIWDATPQNAFFQLYVNKDRRASEKILEQANASGKVKAVFVTVDLPVVSKREDDERAKPETTQEQNIVSGGDAKGVGLARASATFIDPSLCWHDIAWIRSKTHLPVILKGIQRWEDAKSAAEVGCQGIVISNHGGRAADTAPPSIITLLELHRNCPEVFEKIEVLIDGGFRRGSDIVKAICLGASAVGLGRPFFYAVNYGQSGVEHAIEILKDEIETAMRLCGITHLMSEASPEYVDTSQIDHLVRKGGHPYAKQVVRTKSRL